MKLTFFFTQFRFLSVVHIIVLCGFVNAAIKPSQVISGINLLNSQFFSVNLSEVKKATVVMFLSAKCPCSASHQEALNSLSEKFGPLGYTFVAINSNANEDLEFSKKYFQKAKLKFPVIKDSNSEIANHFSAYKTPHVFIVNPKGEILFQGGVDNSKVAEKASRFYLKDALESIQNGELPREKEVRVLGCEIKRP
jgi:peroxiredoxin